MIKLQNVYHRLPIPKYIRKIIRITRITFEKGKEVYKSINIIFKMKKISENDFILKTQDVKFYLPKCGTDLIQREILYTGDYYERRGLDEFFDKYASIGVKGRAVLDIGANIGSHALYFVNEQDALHVYCFEPIKKTYAVLKRNVEINGFQKRITIFNVGVGEETGRGVVSREWDNNWGGTQIKSSNSGNIKIIAIDDMDIDDDIALVKIDVETFENHVIKGMVNTLKKYHPLIKIEIVKENFEEINEILTQLGYVGVMLTYQEYFYQWKKKI